MDYINSGHWSQRGITEAARYCTVHVAGDAGGDYRRVPPQKELRFSGRAAYVHYTPNETISGVEFGYVPETGVCHWWRICPPAFCPGPSTWRSSG